MFSANAVIRNEDFSDETGVPQPPPPPPEPENSTTEIMKHQSFQDLHKWLHTSGFQCEVFARLVNSWMEQSKATRKTLSYVGAIESTEGLPRHYHCQLLDEWYFDPTNFVYSIAMDILYGSLHLQWNAATKGDILEGLLGYHWLLKVQTKQDTVGHEPPHHRKAHMVSGIINFVVERLYRLTMCYATVDRDSLVRALRYITPWPHNYPEISAFEFNPLPTPKVLGMCIKDMPMFLGINVEDMCIGVDCSALAVVHF